MSFFSSVDVIGDKAFFGCISITSFTVSDLTTSIGSNAFSGCVNLSTLTLGTLVDTIGVSAFSDCIRLTIIELPPKLKVIANDVFAGCTALTTIKIPEGVTTISASAFTNCVALSTITIPKSVTSILPGTFKDCPLNNETVASLLNGNKFTPDELKNMGINPATVDAVYCFNENTLILCLNSSFKEEYVKVQDLKKGDIVKTYLHGYKKINIFCRGQFINNPDNFRGCMYKMVKTKENGLVDDLIITGGHAILVDKFTEKEHIDTLRYWKIHQVDNKFLLMSGISDKFEQIKERKLHRYYHFSLENDGDIDKRYGVYANGVLVETPSQKDILTFKHIVFID